MSKPNDGGPAFPRVRGGGYEPSHDGMTLRAYLAGQAMAGYLAMFADPNCEQPDHEIAARRCVLYADALLAELEKPHDPG